MSNDQEIYSFYSEQIGIMDKFDFQSSDPSSLDYIVVSNLEYFPPPIEESSSDDPTFSSDKSSENDDKSSINDKESTSSESQSGLPLYAIILIVIGAVLLVGAIIGGIVGYVNYVNKHKSFTIKV